MKISIASSFFLLSLVGTTNANAMYPRHSPFNPLGMVMEEEGEDSIKRNDGQISDDNMMLMDPFRPQRQHSFFTFPMSSLFFMNDDRKDSLDELRSDQDHFWETSESFFRFSNLDENGKDHASGYVFKKSNENPEGKLFIFDNSDNENKYMIETDKEEKLNVEEDNNNDNIDYIVSSIQEENRSGECPMKKAITKVQSSCSNDFKAFCGDKENFPQHPHPSHPHSHHPHYPHHSDKIEKRGFLGHFFGGNPHQGDDKIARLGFGSREADDCLREHSQAVSSECSESIHAVEELKMKFHSYHQQSDVKEGQEEEAMRSLSSILGNDHMVSFLFSADPSDNQHHPYLRRNEVQNNNFDNGNYHASLEENENQQYIHGQRRPFLPTVMFWLLMLYLGVRLYFLHRYQKHAVQMAPFISALKESKEVQQMLENQVGETFPEPPKKTRCSKFMAVLSDIISYIIIFFFSLMILGQIIMLSSRTYVDTNGVTHTVVNLSPVICILGSMLLFFGVIRLVRIFKISGNRFPGESQHEDNQETIHNAIVDNNDNNHSLYEPLIDSNLEQASAPSPRKNENPLSAQTHV